MVQKKLVKRVYIPFIQLLWDEWDKNGVNLKITSAHRTKKKYLIIKSMNFSIVLFMYYRKNQIPYTCESLITKKKMTVNSSFVLCHMLN